MPLQPGIDGGINDQAVGVEIKSVLFCLVTDLLPYIFPEIATFSPRSGRGGIVECHLFCLCDGILFICNKSVLGHQAEDGIPADRKSTRRNSRHVAIPYTGFCFK